MMDQGKAVQTEISVRTAWAVLILLTALNFLNYIDRSILFAVQPLIEAEFHPTDTQLGILTGAFFFCYMFAAPFVGYLADRYPRKHIMAAGAIVWSLATLLTAITNDFGTLLFRHAVVGIGEASFVTITPGFVADLFPEEKRARIMAVLYLAIPMGTAIGYLVGGPLGMHYGWRSPFYLAAGPGVILGLVLLFIPEPTRGIRDTIEQTWERSSLKGLTRNWAFWSCSLGMAMMTFAVGGLQVWMPTFLSRMRGVPLAKANLVFGGLVLGAGFAATITGGWIGDRLLRRHMGSYYFISGIGMALAIPAMLVAILMKAPAMMYPAIFLGVFFLMLNTSPLNAALVNSVSAPVRSTAVAVNLFTIHALGDAFSPVLIGYVSDKINLEVGFLLTVIAVGLSAVILFAGMKSAPRIAISNQQSAVR